VTACAVEPARGEQLVLFVGVSAEDPHLGMELDMGLDVLAGVLRFVVRDMLQDAAYGRRAVCAFCLHGGGGGGAVCRV